ncbi:MAG: PIN domain-containing protein [Methanocellales archaeon]|nr:PIN domain-containing protein [Methanocellales archaeon]MDI6902817.1 PIN domain-containing protein [Methanocellales archaeon]
MKWKKLNISGENVNPIDQFSGDKIYIDATIFLKYLLGSDDPRVNEKTEDFFQRLADKEFEGIISVLVVDEIVFNYIGALMKIRENLHIADVMRDSPEKIKKYCDDAGEIIDWIASFSKLKVVPVPERTIGTFVDVMRMGLFPRDAIHVATMKELKINDIASYDDDFDLVPDIVRWG